MAISLVSKIFGSGLQVDRQASINTRNFYVPQAPVKTRGEGHYPIYQSQPFFFGSWENPIADSVTLKSSKRFIARKKQPFQFNSSYRIIL